jgi:hypothetical protein
MTGFPSVSKWHVVTAACVAGALVVGAGLARHPAPVQAQAQAQDAAAITDYRIVSRRFSHEEFSDVNCYREFADEVKTLTNAGWVPQGGVSVEFLDTRNYSAQRVLVTQALVKRR